MRVFKISFSKILLVMFCFSLIAATLNAQSLNSTFNEIVPKYKPQGELIFSHHPINPGFIDKSALLSDKIILDQDNYSLYANITLPKGLCFRDVVNNQRYYTYIIALNKRDLEMGQPSCFFNDYLIIPKDKLDSRSYSFPLIPKEDEDPVIYMNQADRAYYHEMIQCFRSKLSSSRISEDGPAQILIYSNSDPKNKNAQFISPVIQLTVKPTALTQFDKLIRIIESSNSVTAKLPQAGRLHKVQGDISKDLSFWLMKNENIILFDYRLTSDKVEFFNSANPPFNPECKFIAGRFSGKDLVNKTCFLQDFWIKYDYIGRGNYKENSSYALKNRWEIPCEKINNLE